MRQGPQEEDQSAQPGRQDGEGGAAQLQQRSREGAELPSHQEGERQWDQDRFDPSEEGEEQGGYLSEGWDTDDYDPTTWGEPPCAQIACPMYVRDRRLMGEEALQSLAGRKDLQKIPD